MARAIAAYQASFVFIENPFFNYLEGQQQASSSDEKRGAILFWSSESGCSNCHDGVTAPYGDKGGFQTLERIVHHYDHIQTSLEEFYNNEVCALEQFKHLTASECVDLINGGDDYILELNRAQIEAVNGVDAPGPAPRNFTDNEIGYLVSYLKSLTDPSAVAGSAEINSLIPPRDGGPDGNQLDAVDESGAPL